MMHVGQGRAHPLHVEYVHIGATLSFVQDVLTEAILSHPRLKMDRKIALVKALSKVIWIQNDLFAKWYVRDGEEFVDERLVPEVEPEGYLHGKKVLHDSSDESEIEESARAAGTCPFKNLARPQPDSPPKAGVKLSSARMSVDESMLKSDEPNTWRVPSPSPIATPTSPSFASGIPRPVSGGSA